MAEAFRVLRPGGMLVAEPQSPHGPADVADRADLRDQVLPEAVVLLCRQAGFTEATAVFSGNSSGSRASTSSSSGYMVVAVR